MPLSWNEIKSRAAASVKKWKSTEREKADAKPFLIDFLNIFGISQRRIATFEHRVKKLNEADGSGPQVYHFYFKKSFLREEVLKGEK